MRKVLLSADSTCDIGPELQKKYEVSFYNYHIILDGKSYTDMVDITPDDLYKAWWDKGQLPKTAAISPQEFADYFRPFVEAGYDVVHINLGSGLSVSHQNCLLAAKELGHVYPIDSENLSSGSGLLVVKAGEMKNLGMTAEEIQRSINTMKPRSHASFLLDTLEFMKAGGRCSAIAAFGANLLKLKPCIEVDNQGGGKMHPSKKYRGAMEKALAEYVLDKLSDRKDLDLDRIFITHSGSPQSDIALVKKEIAKYADFKEIHVTRANSTISAHCGPRTLGVLFMTR